MERKAKRRRLVVLIATVVVVVLASVALPFFQSLETAEAQYPEWNADRLVPDRTVSEGEVAAEPASDAGVVLIDAQHSNRFERNDIRPLVEAISDAGYRVEYQRFSLEFEDQLARADAYVVIDPSDQFDQDEAAAVRSFAEKGGRVLIVGEPRRATLGLFGLGILPVRSRVSTLAGEFGITFGSTFLYDMDQNDGNYLNVFARGTGGGPLSAGVSNAAVYTSTHVQARGGTVFLETRETTRSGRTGERTSFPLAVRTGNVVAIGDKSFMFEGSFNAADNDRLLSNLVTFLITGERTRDLRDFPWVVGPDPTVRYTNPELLGAAQTINANLGADRGTPNVRLDRGTISPSDTDVLVTTFEDLATRGISGTGIIAGGGRVSVDGFEGDLDGVAIVHVPASGYDLIVAADSAERAEELADAVAEEGLDQFVVTKRTAVIRDREDTDVDTTPPEREDDTETETPPVNATATPPMPPGNRTPQG